MRQTIRSFLSGALGFVLVIPCSATLVPQNVQFTSPFTGESHVSDDNTIRAVGNEVNFICTDSPSGTPPGELNATDTNGAPNLKQRGSVVSATDFEFFYSRLDLPLADTIQAFEYSIAVSSWKNVIIPAGTGTSTVGAATVTITETGTSDRVKVGISRFLNMGDKHFDRLRLTKDYPYG